MAAPTTSTEFLTIVRQSGLLNETTFREHFHQDEDLPAEPTACASALIRARLLTPFQAKHLLAGKFRGLCLGPYKLLNQIGQGGMGLVYLAEHTELDRQVALKMLPPDKAKDKLAIERFKREARAAAALDHPNIVRAFDVFHSGAIYFMVMEYVSGKSLGTMLKENGPIHFATAITYILQAAAGLQHAHGKGFVHRDIKPDNLILSKDGVVKLLDMGLARSLSVRDQLTEQLDNGGVVGTADYISPEQALGESKDPRSDIYSLGATLYTLVTGSPPYKGHTTQLLMQHQLAVPPQLPKKLMAPENLNNVIGKMMAKKPADRYQSADEVVEALNPFISIEFRISNSETSTDVRRDGKTKVESRGRLLPPGRGRRLKPWWIAAAGALLVTVLGIGGWLLSGDSTKSPGQPGAAGPGVVGPEPTPSTPQPDRVIKMEGYEASIGADGMMPSFRVNGVEFLNSKVSISRGLYLFQDWKLPKLEDVQQTGNVVTAKGEAGTIRYDFAPNRLNVAVTNTTRAHLIVFVIFDATETAMSDELGQWYKLPFESHRSDVPGAEARWAKTEWFSGKAKVTLTGASAVTGPWEGHQVAEVVVAPGSTKSLVFEAGTPTEAEAAKAAAIIGKTVGHGLRHDLAPTAAFALPSDTRARQSLRKAVPTNCPFF